MNAFGKRNGLGGSAGQRGSFGVARPMKGSATGAGGGEQFPPVPDLSANLDGDQEAAVNQVAAMDRPVDGSRVVTRALLRPNVSIVSRRCGRAARNG